MRYLKYEDIALLPNLGVLASRGDADVRMKLGKKVFRLPVIPANMRSVIDEHRAYSLSEDSYFYIMHRFGVNLIEFCRQAQNWKTISISVGVKEEDAHNIIKLSGDGLRVDYITIDIAHGHSIAMKEMIKLVKKHLPNTFIIAGNVATTNGISDLKLWGADCIKVGIGQGAPCSTKDKTGFTAPMFTCLKWCCEVAEVPIIADGGIKCHGDIAKALLAGATMTMIGSLFSACIDSPAELISDEDKQYKRYFGSASALNKGHNNHIEGFEHHMECNGLTYSQKLLEIRQDLQSAVSYAGGRDLSSLKSVSYIEV